MSDLEKILDQLVAGNEKEAKQTFHSMVVQQSRDAYNSLEQPVEEAEDDEQDMDALKRNIQAQDKEVADAEARLRARAEKVDKNKLKAWYDKYSKYASNNYDNLVWGMIKAWTDTGILTDAYEENEWAAVVDKFGEDKADAMEIDEVMKYMPITKAAHDEIEEMFGTIGQGGADTLEMVYQMLKSMGIEF